MSYADPMNRRRKRSFRRKKVPWSRERWPAPVRNHGAGYEVATWSSREVVGHVFPYDSPYQGRRWDAYLPNGEYLRDFEHLQEAANELLERSGL